MEKAQDNIFIGSDNYYHIKREIGDESKAIFFKLEDAQKFLKDNNFEDYIGCKNTSSLIPNQP